MCIPNLEFQLVNPTTQVSLLSVCFGGCAFMTGIKWTIYEGFKLNSSDVVQWTAITGMLQYENVWFFGK